LVLHDLGHIVEEVLVMNTHTLMGWLGLLSLLTWLTVSGTPPVSAQTLGEMNTVTQGMDTLNSQSPGPNVGLVQAQKEKLQQAGVTNPSAAAVPPGPQGLAQSAIGTVGGLSPLVAAGPKIKVITGTRVFDAVTMELLDDAVVKEVPESEKANYYDDGTHGDLVANDGQYTRVEEEHDKVGQSSQRVKERLVGALVAADQLSPLEFYGYRIMTTDRVVDVPRNRAWRMIPDPSGGPGLVLAEVPVSDADAVSIPKYRKKMEEKDAKVKNDWAVRFLQEYRQNKDSLTSEFYSLHIPAPPPLPAVAPPTDQQWQPFSDPGSLARSEQEAAAKMGPLGASGGLRSRLSPDSSVTGKPIGAASSRYY
jgi:hypothetical protein